MVLLWVPGDTLEKHSTSWQCQLIGVIPIYWRSVDSHCVPSTWQELDRPACHTPPSRGGPGGRRNKHPMEGFYDG